MKEIDLLVNFFNANPVALFVSIFLFIFLFFRFLIYATERITRFQMKRELQKKEIQSILEKYDKLIEKMNQMQDQIIALNKEVGKFNLKSDSDRWK